MKREITFIGQITGERQVPVSSINTTYNGTCAADDAVHSACVVTYNAMMDLLTEHAKTHGFHKGMFRTFKVDIDWVDTDDEDEFVEWKGE